MDVENQSNLLENLFDLVKVFFNFLLLLIQSLLKRFLNPFFIIFFLLLIFLTFNWSIFIKTLSSFGIEEYRLIKDYFQIILSLPTVLLIIGLVFLNKYSESIKKFLENSHLTSVGPSGLSIEQSSKIPQPTLVEDLTLSRSPSESPSPSPEDEANSRADRYELAYLNIALVPNTKETLKRLAYMGSSTKINLLNFIDLPAQITNQLAEKEAIFSALLSNQLIETEGQDLIKVSQKGKKLLRYLGYSIN